MYKLFLTLRYLRKRRIAFFAVAAVTLCVAMVLIVISVMGGFLDMVKKGSRGLLGDIVMDNSSLQGFPFYEEFVGELKDNYPDAIVEATPVVYNYGILRFTEYNITKPVRVVGIRMGEYQRVNNFKASLYYDKYYPGSTTLAPQKIPAYGFDQGGLPVLPPDLEAALQAYRQGNPGDPSRDRQGAVDEDSSGFERQPHGRFPGPGMYVESYEDAGWFGKDAPGLIIGIDLCADRTAEGSYERHYYRGYDVILTLLPMTAGGRESAEGPMKIAMRYADDSRTKVYDIDKLCVYGDFDLLQGALGMQSKELVEGGFSNARASQIQMKLADGLDANVWRDKIEAHWRTFAERHELDGTRMDGILMDAVDVVTWEQKQVAFIAAVEKEKVLVTILFGIISIVAVVLVGCIFYMIVQEKTRDIGIIKGIGASSRGVASIFLVYGAAVGVVGSILGSIIGTTFVWYINDIQDWLAGFSPQLRVWSPEVYTFDTIPNMVKSADVIGIIVVAIIASTMGSLVAAIRAARVWPVQALRYE